MKSLRVITLCLFCMFLASSKCLAADNQDGNSKRLVVWLKNGEKVFFDLEEFPKTTFMGNEVVIETNTFTTTYPIDQVLKYTYESKTTEIRGITDNDVLVSQDGNVLTFGNVKHESPICIYTINGILLEKIDVFNHRRVYISLNNHPSGIYLIKLNDLTYKILKK